MEPTQHRIEIADLVAQYVEAVATADRELFRSVWADDASWVVDGRGTFRGPDEITELFWRLRMRQELAVQRVVSGRAVVHPDNASASGRWVIHSLTRTEGVGADLVGIYDDKYVYERHRWQACNPRRAAGRRCRVPTWCRPGEAARSRCTRHPGQLVARR